MQDAALFEALFRDGNGRADYNRDHVIDGLDRLEFLNALSRQAR